MEQQVMHAPVETVVPTAEQEAIQQMLARSAVDRDFRSKMLENPRLAFAEYGCELAYGVDISFVENQADVTIVLPDPIDAMLELSEAELVEINGGGTPGFAALSSEFCVGAVVSASAALIGMTIRLVTK